MAWCGVEGVDRAQVPRPQAPQRLGRRPAPSAHAVFAARVRPTGGAQRGRKKRDGAGKGGGRPAQRPRGLLLRQLTWHDALGSLHPPSRLQQQGQQLLPRTGCYHRAHTQENHSGPLSRINIVQT
eukprot:83409-Chlamydomonas_euryale.AAC.2